MAPTGNARALLVALITVGLIVAMSSTAQAQQRCWWFGKLRCEDCPPLQTQPNTIPLPKIDVPQTTLPESKEPALDFNATPDPMLAPVTTAALGSGAALPQMMGDFTGYQAAQTVSVPVTTQRVTQITPSLKIVSEPGFQTVVVYNPVAARGSGFKIGENTSPKPIDRVFATYNYFHEVSGRAGFTPTSTTPPGTPVVNQITFPATSASARTFNFHRQILGFEKVFFGGNASITVRVPFTQVDNGDPAYSDEDLGDITTILKYALINDNQTGQVFSVGLGVTAPTGPAIPTIYGNINSVLLQPWFGYIQPLGNNCYITGIHSLVVPTESRDLVVMFNDVAFTYFMPRQSGIIAFVAPTIEMHVTTPLEGRDGKGALYVPDIVAATGGVHIGLLDGRPLLSLGVVSPLTGPTPYTVEAFAQFNFRF